MNIFLMNSRARLALRVTPGQCHTWGVLALWVRCHARSQAAFHFGALSLAPVGVLQLLERSQVSENQFPHDKFTAGPVCKKSVPQTSICRSANSQNFPIY